MSKLLILSANPIGKDRLNAELERETIEVRLAIARVRHLTLVFKGGVRPQSLAGILSREQPSILHFSMHCSNYGDLLLEDDEGKEHPVEPEKVKDALQPFAGVIQCCVLNACFSDLLAGMLAEQIGCVIGMSSAIRDDAAITFAAGFYQAIGFGHSVKTAFDLGRSEMALLGIPGDKLPELFPKDCASHQKLFLSGRPELRAEFVLKGDRSLKMKGDNYKIRLYIHNVPAETRSVVYQLNDPTYDGSDEQFEDVQDVGPRSFGKSFYTYGDLQVRASLWYNEGGEGLNCSLSEALERTYGCTPRGAPGSALKQIREH